MHALADEQLHKSALTSVAQYTDGGVICLSETFLCHKENFFFPCRE